MREAVGIPAGFLAYFLATILLLLFFRVFFPNPQEWAILITIATAFIAFKITCAAVVNFSNETGVKIVAFMIAAFWLLSLGIDMFDIMENVITFLSASQDSTKSLEGFKELLEAVWNSRICAVVTAILAARTLSK